LPKIMFGCPLKLILKFSGICCISGIKQKHSYTVMYECEKSPLTHELSYIGLLSCNSQTWLNLLVWLHKKIDPKLYIYIYNKS
jgi:hypothetical protein